MRFTGNGLCGTENLLYHYTSVRAALRYILPTGLFRLGRLQHSNDPLEEVGFDLRIPRPMGSVNETVLSAVKRGLAAAVEAEQGLIKGARFACFTQDRGVRERKGMSYGELSAGRGWARDGLWGHYADGHRGVCLLFDRAKLEVALRSQMHPKGFFWAGTVTYSNALDFERGRVLNLDDWAGRTRTHRLHAFASRRRRLREVFGFKRQDWRSEREHRIVMAQPYRAPALFNVREALAGFIVGARFDAKHHDALKALSNQLHVPAFKVEYHAWPLVRIVHLPDGMDLGQDEDDFISADE